MLIIGAGPTGICTLLSVMLKNPKRIIMCEKDEKRMHFIREHYPEVLTVSPEECFDFVQANSEHGARMLFLKLQEQNLLSVLHGNAQGQMQS